MMVDRDAHSCTIVHGSRIFDALDRRNVKRDEGIRRLVVIARIDKLVGARKEPQAGLDGSIGREQAGRLLAQHTQRMGKP